MKKLNNCEVPNCIPTPSSCVEWNGGDIEFLGICNGDNLNTLMWEIVTKLQDITGEDLSQFDIDSLLDICNTKAPSEISIINILNVIKANQICLKDYVDNLSNQLSELLNESKVNINLKCYAVFDNIGNELSVTRDQLDQLVIDSLCAQKDDIETLEGKVTSLQNQIDELSNNSTVEELSFATCVDSATKPTSSQVKAVATAHCNLQEATGTVLDISTALAKTPEVFGNIEFKSIEGWIQEPANWSQNYNNVLLALSQLLDRVKFMEENCCALTCDDVELGFNAVLSEDGNILITFNNATGTKIPAGMVDKGTKGTVTDKDGNKISFSLVITNNYEFEIPVSGLNTKGELKINIDAKIGNDSLVCSKCLNKTITLSGCGVCEITASGDSGAYAVIVYEIDTTTTT